MELGVCYYPEHWPTSRWAEDARRMREIGISWVRIAEFAWSVIEPESGRFEWAWLDEAIETLHGAGLKIVLCTPTATPPKWLVDRDPDILAADMSGHARGFGSRRHYCFSSESYRAESRRITRALAERYGRHPAVQAWQTDNEYGCHDTVLSTSGAAKRRFRAWLAQRYGGDVEALNLAWGTVFWSQRYRNFDEVDLPVGTVTEANPSHRLDWRRFASDEVAAFNREQVAILRECSPGRPVSHNFMGFFTEFDHHDVAADLDIATWDSYPLGFTQNFFLAADEKVRWARTGHPDIPAFHHDLYRGLCADASGRGRWWVMEQQPGPVNWAQWNPAPAPGMVRLWTWQAFAHGAEVVSYFRWRQAPFAQEQMHAGLLRSDASEAEAAHEAAQVAAELHGVAQALGRAAEAPAPLHGLSVQAPVALVFDYASIWMAQIQPQGGDYNALELVFRCYSALRSLGLAVDIVPARGALEGYRLVVLPAVLHADAALAARLQGGGAQVVLGPRCASKTATLQIPSGLPPGPLAGLAGWRVERVESLPPGLADSAMLGHETLRFTRWREQWALQGAEAEARFADGRTALARQGRCRSVAGWLDEAGWRAVLRLAAADAGLAVQALPEGLRIQQVGPLAVACNFSERAQQWQPAGGGRCLVGAPTLEPCMVAVWQLDAATPAAQAASQHGRAALSH